MKIGGRKRLKITPNWTFTRFKKQFRFEPYLDNISRGLRVPVTKLRISNHCLPVEVQRYHKKPKKREERKCPICRIDETADEYHYLLRCANIELSGIRKNFFDKIRDEIPQLKNFSNTTITEYCLVMSDTNTHVITAEYIRDILGMYREEAVPSKPITAIGKQELEGLLKSHKSLICED